MKKIITGTLLLCSLGAMALTPTPNDKPPVDKVFINANIHVGNGEVLENAHFAVADGKITRAGYYKAPYTGDEIDLKGAHIYPGLILTNTNLGLVVYTSINK